MRHPLKKTYWTYLIGTLALAGIFPLSGFWSKDEILAGTGSFPGTEGANGSYHLMLIMLLLAAFCTAAYMTRTVWYAFYGEYRGHGTPHEGGPRITVPLIILATLGAIAGFANMPQAFEFLPDGLQTRFEHYVEPVGLYFPAITHAEFNAPLAIVSVGVALLGGGIAYLYYFRDAFAGLHGLAERNRLAGFFKNILVNKYYFDWLYTNVIVGFVKRPLAAATNWVNQHVIDGLVNLVGKTAVGTGGWVYKHVDQQVVDGAVNGAGMTAGEAGSALRLTQSGRIQQYAALFFAAVAILAAVFVVVIG
jgi:NADH-quinone oxidoreductase subunit L